jgi:predicted nuclease of predicted toxin-antitoxin system
MKILLDECVDWRLAREIAGHEVTTARQMGWTAIKNGELLALAIRHGFEAFVTVDRNLSFQQNVAALTIAVIVFGLPATAWPI